MLCPSYLDPMAALRTVLIINIPKSIFPTWCQRKALRLCKYGVRHLTATGFLFDKRRSSQDQVDSDSKTNRQRHSKHNISSLIKPRPSRSIYDEYDEDIGVDMVGELDKVSLNLVLKKFSVKPQIRALCEENGLDHELFRHTLQSFTTMCMEQKLSPDLHIKLHDILNGAGNIDQLFPFFLEHSRNVFPHLDNMNQISRITDLTSPTEWYVDARKIARKIVIHAGPTNSGKTYHAMKQFVKADRGIYCSPLRLLAGEVSRKSNASGTPCDLVTGEERTYANEDDTPADHLACTVEMANLSQEYDVAVIDEMQMVRDKERGWAWTQAFLGLLATEIHVCGEPAIIPLIENLAVLTGDTVQVKTYDRLTSLTYLDAAVAKFENVRPGDCFVCFGKPYIFSVVASLEKLGIQAGIIYGNLPPATKIAQANRFNDPKDPCNVLVATDAVGMGLNLNIKRMIFYHLEKTHVSDTGERVRKLIETSTARQIAGRAGRFNSHYPEGEVTTFFPKDLPVLKDIVQEEIEPIQRAGMNLTADQIEAFDKLMPNTSLCELIEMFEMMATHDEEHFFMCDMTTVKYLAGVLEVVHLPLKVRYTYSCAPVSENEQLVVQMFLKYALKHSKNEPVDLKWLTDELGWPLSPPKDVASLTEMEAVYNSLDVYLWLGCRFIDIYPDPEPVRAIQEELEIWIEDGIRDCMDLLRQQSSDKEQNAKHKDTGKSPAPISSRVLRQMNLDAVQDPKLRNMMLNIDKIGTKDLKKIAKQLNLDLDSMIPTSKIGKHPRKSKINKNKSIKTLEKMFTKKKKK